MCLFFFFFNDTATTEIYTLSLHDALPISQRVDRGQTVPYQPEVFSELGCAPVTVLRVCCQEPHDEGVYALRDLGDRKSTRLNSSHANISYAVFCLKKKKNTYMSTHVARTE